MENLHTDRRTTCCFAGYRPYKYPFPFNEESPEYVQLVQDIRQAVTDSYRDGYRTFLCGGMIGFDIVAAEVVLELTAQFRDMRLIFLLPYPNHDRNFPIEWRVRFRRVYNRCDAVYHIDETCTNMSYQSRNLDLVLNSTRVIAYFSGRSGGTAGIIARAQQLRLQIVNLYVPPKRDHEFTYFTGCEA